MAKFDNPWRTVAFVGVVGLDFAFCVVAGFLLGRYLDRLFATEPWLLLFCLIMGIAIGVYSVYRLVRPYL
ncbi:AtpZ/AtpI family protein [Brevibacillus sp. TJ4]|uniref:AtpZ/AtpI family protein n=1 Tax=Brevibacillus sp. TJ4 TaxID=3234853 RepID=UPI0037DD7CD9